MTERQDVAAVCKFHDGIEREIRNIKDVLDRVANRPPLWCTFALSAFTFVIGWLTSLVLNGHRP